MSQEEYEYLTDFYNCEYYTKDGKVVREDGHFYPTSNGGKAYCMDRIYIQGSKEFTLNNYGTAKDDTLSCKIEN